MPPVTSRQMPTLELVLNLLRAICNDSFAGATNTPGEGQILTDLVPNTPTTNPQVLHLLSSAIRELYRKLRIAGSPSFIQDNFIVQNLPTVNGPLGASTADPTIQTYLSTQGYFDGSTINNAPGIALPDDLLAPIKLWERTSDTTDTFQPMEESTSGLNPRNQTDRLVNWEWRYGRINFNGATTPRDVRIRYFCALFDPSMNNAAGLQNASTLYIPIFDCQEFVAYSAASKISLSLGNPQITTYLDGRVADALFDLRSERTRRDQYQTVQRMPYNDADTAQELDVYGI